MITLKVSNFELVDIPADMIEAYILEKLISNGFDFSQPISRTEDYENNHIIFKQ